MRDGPTSPVCSNPSASLRTQRPISGLGTEQYRCYYPPEVRGKHSEGVRIRPRLRKRVRPAQTGKARKIAIGRVEHRSVFDRKRGDLRITHQWTKRLAFKHHLPERPPMIVARRQNPNVRLFEPMLDFSHRLKGRASARQPRVCADAQKGRNGLPWQADRLGPRKKILYTSPSFLVLWGSGRVAIEKNVCVENDHRW
jgi:hypothetical protein